MTKPRFIRVRPGDDARIRELARRFPMMPASKIVHAALSYGLRAALDQPMLVLLGAGDPDAQPATEDATA